MASFAQRLNSLISGKKVAEAAKPMVKKATPKTSNAQRDATEKAMDSAYKATKVFR